MAASSRHEHAAAGAYSLRLPDFFIVGHMKSGTTALYDLLRRHPQIHMPKNKEPWFFASELTVGDLPRPRKQGRTPTTLGDYLSLFARAQPGQLVGEASATYLWSRTAASRIAELQPRARIIAILREPASFLRSLHAQFVQNYTEPEKSFRKALALEDERRAGKHLPRNGYWPGATLYSEHVRYVEQLGRFHAHFPREQVLVLIYDDFRRDNEGTARAVLRFLEVDEDSLPRPREVNPTVRVRSQRLHGLLHALARAEGRLPPLARRAAQALAPPQLRRQALVRVRDRLLFAAAEDPDQTLMLELRRRYKHEVVALSEYLGRDLVGLWGYESM